MKQRRIEDYGISIGTLPKGKLNKITDVRGIKVGHSTIDRENIKTGVTVVIPREENIYLNKLIAASYVLNGYGKTIGLVQIEELGTLESIIALTNTLNVGLVHDALVEYMIEECKKENSELTTYNPIVCECNDSFLNDISLRAVKKEHVFEAIKNAMIDFEEGDVGAGKGMSCHQLKGGIGSASRIVELDGEKYTVGVLVQSNHGALKDLTINGKNIGIKIAEGLKAKQEADKGSIISIIATDIPLSSRQLKRICKRTGVGLARLGSFIGHGSGEIVIAFSTANTIPHNRDEGIHSIKVLNEDKIDLVFRAVAECEEEAVLNSMITAETVTGFKGRTRYSLRDYIEYLTDC
ncbi:DmpA family aminopeptidase [Tepidimicrobium xylanilyticum]|uniref:DmpA family aminopeptidase n=1 Tax=Tepidimicrobium xylanilyticum TaxID=1123352 RepID=UPI00265437C1|nr:P1 family peptidase [Tepidimicrobium xylanilyticum]GMG95990.1 aminopeptidase [Tepidimicrobium xylanilyticum]